MHFRLCLRLRLGIWGSTFLSSLKSSFLYHTTPHHRFRDEVVQQNSGQTRLGIVWFPAVILYLLLTPPRAVYGDVMFSWQIKGKVSCMYSGTTWWYIVSYFTWHGRKQKQRPEGRGASGIYDSTYLGMCIRA